MVRQTAGWMALLVLGMSLARRGGLAIASIVICFFTSALVAVAGVVLALRGPQSPAYQVPLLASGALAWGGGFLLAFAAGAHALRRDRSEGIRQLIFTRTTSMRGYLLARVGGLAVLIALLVGGGTLVSGLATTAAAQTEAVPRVLHATVAGLVFSIAFAAVVAPIAFAALGARSRFGGYLFLVAVVLVPELLVLLTGSLLPASVLDVVSPPSALAALRAAMAPGTVDIMRAARAIIALSLFAAVATAVVRRAAFRIERAEVDA